MSLESTDFTDEARENIDFWNKETICNALNINSNYINTINKTGGKTILETKARDERSMVLKNIENLGKNKIISWTNLFLLNTEKEFAGNNQYKASIELREMSKEEMDLRKEYKFEPIDMITSVQKNEENISLQTNQWYSLEFNNDYTNPVLVYGGKKYNVYADVFSPKQIQIKKNLLPSLTNFDSYLDNGDNITANIDGGGGIFKEFVKFDLHNDNEINIGIPIHSNDLTSIRFTLDGKLTTHTAESSDGNTYDIITKDGWLQITKVPEGEKSLLEISRTINDIKKDLSIQDGSLKINPGVNISERKIALDNYTDEKIEKIKTKVWSLSDKNNIRKDFDEMIKIRDLAKTTLENYKKVFDNQEWLKEKRYVIETDDSWNIKSLIKDKRIGKDKPYITSNNWSINIWDLSKVIEDID